MNSQTKNLSVHLKLNMRLKLLLYRKFDFNNTPPLTDFKESEVRMEACTLNIYFIYECDGNMMGTYYTSKAAIFLLF